MILNNMERKIFLFVFLFILATPFISADTFKQWSNIDIRHPVRVNGGVSSSLTVNITILDPENVAVASFAPMSFDAATQDYNYTLPGGSTGKLGTYNYCITATNNAQNETSCFDFSVTPDGKEGLLGYYFLIIILSYGVMGLGIWKRDITVTMLGNFALFFVGIWILYFGIDIFKNYLTNGFAIVTLGVAFYVSAKVAHEYLT